ncbi:hypothetical protein [Butyrivibrio sp. FCS014]|uniref:hypothetical protein n=1 Tax=Butyrivibrio sp. FCS014 TaxID=1408304 RepID=UPI000467A308|nr:hypothetical protein [Butyrivibrio sp. FCS014]
MGMEKNLKLNIARNTFTIRELTFYCFFMIMFGMRMWGIYESKSSYVPLLVVGFLVWGISVLMSEYSVLEYIVICAFMILAGIVYIKTGEKGLLLYFALMMGVKNINVNRLFKAGIIAGGSGIAVLSFLSAFGIIEDVAYLQERHFVGEVFRRSLGAPHPNTLSSSFVIIAMMVMYVIGHNNKPKIWLASVVVLLIGMYLFLYSGSRTGMLLLCLYLAINMIYAYMDKTGIITRIISILIMPVIWAVCILIPFIASDDTISFFRSVEYNLGSRFAEGKYYLDNNPLSLFGIRLSDPDAHIYGIDMSQLYLFIQLGIVAFCVVSLLWILLLKSEISENKKREIPITISLLIMGITDPFLYNIGFKNLAFVFMGVMVYGYLNKLNVAFTPLLAKEIQILKIGEKEIGLPVICEASQKGKLFDKKNNSLKMIIVGVLLILLISTMYYCITPKPAYVLSDRNAGERLQWIFQGMEGHTYDKAQIKAIKNEGNIVLDYTDEDELMYVYYSDDKSPVQGGYYAPNAGNMEKFRLALSLFVWGSIFVILIIYIFSYKNTKR